MTSSSTTGLLGLLQAREQAASPRAAARNGRFQGHFCRRFRAFQALHVLPDAPAPAAEGAAAAANAPGPRGGARAPAAAATWLDLDPSEGRFLLGGSADGAASLFDTREFTGAGSALARVHAPHSRQRVHAGAAASVQWYPVDNGLFLTASADGKVALWDTNTLQAVCAIEHPDAVHCAFMSGVATGHCYIASGAEDGQVRICDPLNGRCISTLSGHGHAVQAVAWAPDDDWILASGDRAGQVRAWDIRQPGALLALDRHHVQADLLYFGDAGGGVGTAGTAPPPPGGASAQARRRDARAHGGAVQALLFRSSAELVSRGADQKVRLWDLPTGRNRLVANLPRAGTGVGAKGRPLQSALHPDLAHVLTPSGTAVHVAPLAPAKGRPPTRFEGHLEGVTCCALDAAGRTLFSGSGDGQVLLWTAASLPADDDATHASENCDAWSEDSADDLLAQYDV